MDYQRAVLHSFKFTNHFSRLQKPKPKTNCASVPQEGGQVLLPWFQTS